MLKAFLAVAVLAVAGAALPVAAQADDYGYGYRDGPPPPPPGRYVYDQRPPMPFGPRSLVRKLRWQGYGNIEILNQRREITIVRAETRRGFDVILVVDSFSGQVLRQRPADRGPRYPHDGPGYGGPGYDGPGFGPPPGYGPPPSDYGPRW